MTALDRTGRDTLWATDRGRYPDLVRLTDLVTSVWPEHTSFLSLRFGTADEGHLAFCDGVARRIWAIIDADPERYAQGYRWTCDRMIEEEYHFQRTGRYRFDTSADVEAALDLESGYMSRYTDGLLLSQLFWRNHADVLRIYVEEFLPEVTSAAPTTVLEVGPGHGLLLALATERPGVSAVGWDASAASVANTRAALRSMGTAEVALERRNLHEADRDRRFDVVVASELLEHVDRPDEALGRLRDLTRPGGHLFLNIPVNSPAPDHINLWRTPEEIAAYVTAAGLEICRRAAFPMTGYNEDEAREDESTISCVLVCRTAGTTSYETRSAR